MHIERYSTERLLTHLPKEWIMATLRVSPDGKNVAYQLKRTMGKRMKVNEITHPKYNEISPLVFSPNSKHTVYSASQNNKQFMVYDTENLYAYSYVYIQTLAFLADGESIAYGVQKSNDKFSMVFGQTEEGDYENLVRNAPVFNEKGDYAYLVEEDNLQFVVKNGEKLKGYDKIEGLHFAKGSDALNYLVKNHNSSFMVIADEPQPKHDFVSALVTSEDGNAMAYFVEDNFRWKVVASHYKSKTYDEIKELVLSADGKRLAFSARKGEVWFVVLDGEEQPAYDGIGEMKFSPDGKRFAYKAMRYVKGFLKKVPTSCVVLDGVESRFYEGIGQTGFNFNASSTRFGYSAIDKQHSFAVIDGVESVRYDGIGANTPFFTKDNDHVVLVASFGGNLSVLIDESVGSLYKSIVMRQGGGIHFDGPEDLHYISLIDEELYLIEEKLSLR